MATPFKSIGPRTRSWFTARQQRPMRKQDKRCRPRLEGLEERTLLSFNAAIGDVFYIEMENHNLTQPSNVPPGTPEQLLGNPAAPYLNSLITPGNPNAAQTSYASNYYNVAPGIHPSEPNDLSDLFLRARSGQYSLPRGGNTNDQLNITPIGASQTGSTGINVNGQLNGVYINNQTFTGVTSIYAVGFGGNDNFQFAGSLTIPSVVRAGDGNDTVNLGNGTNTVTLGAGNNTVTAGNGNDQVQLGNGTNTVTLGTGNNTVTAGNGNDQVQLGNGTNTVTLGHRQQHRHCRQWQRPGATR